MRRSADEIDRAVAQRRIGLVDRKHELHFDVEPLLPEEAELRSSNRRKIRVGNHVGYSEFHGRRLTSTPPARSSPSRTATRRGGRNRGAGGQAEARHRREPEARAPERRASHPPQRKPDPPWSPDPPPRR